MIRRPAFVVQRIGPYHKARLKALGATVDQLLALEVCAIDETYDWEVQSSGDQEFQRLTLFSHEAEARNAAHLRRLIVQALDKFEPDCVAAPGWSAPSALFALDWARRRRVPSILMSDSQAYDSVRNPVAETLKRVAVRNACAGFVGGWTHEDYLVSLGMERSQIFRGYDVVDNHHFEAGAGVVRAAPESRELLGLPERYLLAVGRFVPKKNLSALIEAHARYSRASKSPLPLVIVGDGPLRGALERKAGPLVTLRPFASYAELPSLYGLAEGLVLPSTVEQWGLVVNEAMAAGCAVLASSSAGATAELVEDGFTGLVTDPDVDSLERALQRFEAADRPSLAEAARARIETWGLDRFVNGFDAAAEAALAARQRRFDPIGGLTLNALAFRGAD